jgi:hypothetical protein
MLSSPATMPRLSALVGALILERPLCMPCLTEKTSTTAREIEEALTTIEHVHRLTGRCRSCGNIGDVLYLDPSG